LALHTFFPNGEKGVRLLYYLISSSNVSLTLIDSFHDETCSNTDLPFYLFSILVPGE
jgi:hypothetical protein